VYVIDTSSLVESWWRRYPLDVAPDLWGEKLGALIADGRLIAPDEVLNELKGKDDELYAWLLDHKSMFVELGPELFEVTQQIINNPEFVGMMKNRPARNGADPFVVGLAHLRGYTVVTEEHDDGPTKCKIPYVCRRLGVPCINVLGLIRAERWQFGMR
jgi:Domain of unknown function (DUF4411)